MDVEAELKKSKNQWEYKVFLLIQELPAGCVITYGGLAKRANSRFGLNLVPRNIANLRRKLYLRCGHDTNIPLHRIATQGDGMSKNDSPITQVYNQRLRSAEGSWPEPKWLYE
jgi:alkylated DNA nucleotide flippase Atl1